MSEGVTVIIPAFNEEGNLEAAVKGALSALQNVVDDYEVLIIDDGSQDATLKIAQSLAGNDVHIRVLRNEPNRGYGFSYQRGVREAKKEYVTVFPGDNDTSAASLKELILLRRNADLIASYMANTESRSRVRRFTSKTYVIILNVLFNLRLPYFNGMHICKTALLHSIPITSHELDVLAECKIRLIKRGCSYKFIAFEHTGRHTGQSKAFKFRTLMCVAKTICLLLKDVYCRQQNVIQTREEVHQ